ncbi:MAG: hypothetical protein HC769_24895 [Cyanobacteria bacterium CRU_2_1]|nr:hypothetical protein [Cyanobacteria bacterium CRU_2_1]
MLLTMLALKSSEKTHLPSGAVVRLPATWEDSGDRKLRLIPPTSLEKGGNQVNGLVCRSTA